MTRKEIVRTIAEEIGLPQRQTKEIIEKTLDSVVNLLVADGRVEIRNFGVFEVRWRKARKARNPRTGEEVHVPRRCAVAFKPGLVLEQRVEEEGCHRTPR